MMCISPLMSENFSHDVYLTPDACFTSPYFATTRVRALRHGLGSVGSTWWMLKLANMSTITREWSAMQNAQFSPFMDILLTGKPR